jgi:hypothetical protein
MALKIRPFYQPPIYHDNKKENENRKDNKNGNSNLNEIIRHKGTLNDPLVLGKDGQYY